MVAGLVVAWLAEGVFDGCGEVEGAVESAALVAGFGGGLGSAAVEA